MSQYTLQPIATIQSPYKQKFAIPRQPRLIPQAKAKCVFIGEFNREEFVRGIEDFSHVWIIFRFHETADKGWSPLVRPPRLGGNDKKGVFATRATFRPNAIGMSTVKLDGVEYKNGQLSLLLSGIDLLDGTPVLDIKPYLPYSDALPDAAAGFADTRPETDLSVALSHSALAFCDKYHQQYPALAEFICNVLKQDPRPAYKKQKVGLQEYGMSLYDLNIKWEIVGEHAIVKEITKMPSQA